MKKIFLVLVLLTVFLCSWAPFRSINTPEIRGFSPKSFSLNQSIAFVLAGQSNMVANQDRIETKLRLKHGNSTQSIKCARPNSSINTWQRGQVNYENCAAKTKDVIRTGYKVVGILWFQGETDALNHMPSLEYQNKFVRFVLDFRGDISRPGLPIVYAQLGPVYRDTGAWWIGIQNTQKFLDARSGFHMFTTMDIARIPNDLHYDELGYKRISARFVNSTQSLIP